ncbi:MAG: SDR family oxidoreductase [Solirubrobacterales bacterium]|nr:SDR family oxidoreductase [Solirubrobacterales bacterium]
MAGRVCVVTGASSGIGYESALGLASKGASVVLVCRNSERGEAACDRLRAETPQAPEPGLVLADLSEQAQVRTAAAEIADRYEALHVLVNNAGAINARRTTTTDGIETTFALNHLAPFLLTRMLGQRLRAGAPARVVTVSSDAHRSGHLEFDDLSGARKYGMWSAYAQSKLANVLFTTELARRTAGTGVTATCLHPGFVRSRFARNNGPLGALAMTVASPFAISVKRGARTSVHLASAAEVEGESGGYYSAELAANPSLEARDSDVAARLWAVSSELTGVRS